MSLYLLINIAAIAIPLAFSFDKRTKFHQKWIGFLIGFIIVGGLFIFWDVWFTKTKVWGFNPVYLSGYYFFNLPVEELLFFFCIPYASIFTHYALLLIKKFKMGLKVASVISILIAGFSLSIAVIYPDRIYTFVTSLVTAASIIIALIFFKRVLQTFLLSYLVILVPFLIVNGILTGSFIKDEVVWYNNNENLGIRLFTIPVEDVFYGFSLLLLIVLVMETFFKLKNNKKNVSYG